jgi:hypothetical protein
MNSVVTIDPETGVIEKRTVMTTTVSKSGYVRVKYNGKTCSVHRLVWEHVHGPIPDGMHIDHINGVKSDNRIANLRLVTPSQNAQNRPRATGASFSKSRGKWQSQICVDGRRYNLGWHDNKDDAVLAYTNAAGLVHTHNPRAVKNAQEKGPRE